jgi:hypothetical protein
MLSEPELPAHFPRAAQKIFSFFILLTLHQGANFPSEPNILGTKVSIFTKKNFHG